MQRNAAYLRVFAQQEQKRTCYAMRHHNESLCTQEQPGVAILRQCVCPEVHVAAPSRCASLDALAAASAAMLA